MNGNFNQWNSAIADFEMQIRVKIKLRLSIQLGHGAGTEEIENFCNFIISYNFVVLMNINGKRGLVFPIFKRNPGWFLVFCCVWRSDGIAVGYLMIGSITGD